MDERGKLDFLRRPLGHFGSNSMSLGTAKADIDRDGKDDVDRDGHDDLVLAGSADAFRGPPPGPPATNTSH